MKLLPVQFGLGFILLLDSGRAEESIRDCHFEATKTSRQIEAQLQKLLFSQPGKVDTYVFAIAKGDCLLFSKYKSGYNREHRYLDWSVAKSVSSIVIGRAVKLGLISMEDPVLQYFPEFKGQISSHLKLFHLLNFSSGIHWNESYEYSPLESDVLKMLFGSGRFDMPRYVLGRGENSEPGGSWNYSSGDSNLLMGCLRIALQKNGIKLESFVQDQVLKPLGVDHVSWEMDGAGNFVASSYFYSTPEALLKIGEFVLSEWKSARFLPQNWIKGAAELSPFFDESSLKKWGDEVYGGAHWWVTSGNQTQSIPNKWPKLGEPAFMAIGHWGQILGILPKTEIVLLRLGRDKKGRVDLQAMFQMAKDYALSLGAIK